MGEANKCCESKCGGGGQKGAATLLKVIVGLAFLGAGGWTLLRFWPELLVIVKGGLGLSLILIGVITLAIAKE